MARAGPSGWPRGHVLIVFAPAAGPDRVLFFFGWLASWGSRANFVFAAGLRLPGLRQPARPGSKENSKQIKG